MKIAWFTPFNSKSAIAKVSKFIVENFPTEDCIDIWHSEPTEDTLLTNNKKIFYSPENKLTKLSEYDYIIYNLGNNHIFHGPIYEVSQKYSGVVILHDYTLHIFFEELYKLKGTPEMYLRLIDEHYGKDALLLAEKSIKGELLPTLSRSDSFLQMPLYEPALENSIGAFVHSSFSKKTIEKQFLLPIDFSYLPFPFEKIKKHDKANLRKKLNLPEDKIIFISTGIVHPIKRIEKFIEAWGNSRNKADFYYCIIGDYGSEYFQLLNELAINGMLNDSIKFLGWTSEDVLTDYLNACDIAINLRYPNTEGCSYSAVEQLSHELPIICNNTGFYSELPDEISFKVNLGNEITEIKNIIESISSIDIIRTKSINAREFSRKYFDVKNYISVLKKFLDSLKAKTEYNFLFNKYYDWVADQYHFLFNNIDYASVKKIDDFFTFKTDLSATKNRSLGIWFGFPYPVELRREGITRFAVSFATALIKEYQYEIEIWCYEFNRVEMEVSFSSILSDPNYSKFIKIVSEKNYFEALDVKETNLFNIQDNWEINNRNDNLFLVANKYSKSATFLVAIVYLVNATNLNKKTLIAAHDLQPLIDYTLFCQKNPDQDYYIRKIYESANAFCNKGSLFFSNSKHVLETQIKHFLPDLKENQSHFIYLPGNFPIYKNPPLTIVEFNAKFDINKPFLFLATQFRPYKNLIVLLKAALLNSEILKKYNLIFTGNLSDDIPAKELVETTELKNIVRTVGPLSEEDLRNFYLNASFVVVPTLFEGGFPWQAIEAMSFNKPVLMSKIPITIERLDFEGFSKEYTEFMLFNPYSEMELSHKITEFLKNKELFHEKQRPIACKILSYDWQKAIKVYAKKLNLLT